MKITKKIMNDIDALDRQALVTSNTMILIERIKRILNNIEDSLNWEFNYSYLTNSYLLEHKLGYIHCEGRTIFELISDFKLKYKELSDEFKND